MNSATALDDTTPAPVRAPRLPGLYLLLIIMAAIEAFDGVSHAPILFGDMSEIPGPGIGGAIILGPATMLVNVPTLFGVLAVIAFGISVFLYGF